jgi:hypothetical protein
MGIPPANPEAIEMAGLQRAATRAEVPQKQAFIDQLRLNEAFAALPNQPAIEAAIFAVNPIPAGFSPEAQSHLANLGTIDNANNVAILAEVRAIDTDAVVTANLGERDVLLDQSRNKIWANYRDLIRAAGTDQQVVDLQRTIAAELSPTALAGMQPEIDELVQMRTEELRRDRNAQAIIEGTYAPIVGAVPVANLDPAQAIAMLGDIALTRAVGEIGTQNLNELTDAINQRVNTVLTERLGAIDLNSNLLGVVTLEADISDAEVNGIITGAQATELRRRRNEAITNTRNTVQANVRNAWTQLINQYGSTTEARARVAPVLDALRNRHGAPELALLGIDMNAMVQEFADNNNAVLSNDINTYLQANPAGNVEAFILTLNPAYVARFGGDAQVRAMYLRNTDDAQRTGFLRTYAEIVANRGGAQADLDQILDENGFNRAGLDDDFRQDARRQYEGLTNNRIRTDTEKGLNVLNEQYAWNEMTLQQRLYMFTNNRADMEAAMRAKGMTPAEVNRAVNRLEARALVENDLLVDPSTAVDTNLQNEDFDQINDLIEGIAPNAPALSPNQQEALRQRMNLVRENFQVRTGFYEAVGRRMGMDQATIDNLRNFKLNAKEYWVNVKAAIKVVGVGGIVLMFAASGLPIGTALLLAAAAGGATGLLVAPGWYNERNKVRSQNTSIRLAMAERRVAEDNLTELTRETLAAVNLLSGTRPDLLLPEQRDLLEKYGVLKNGRIDINGIVLKMGEASQGYSKSVENLRKAFDTKKKQLGNSDRQQALNLGLTPTNFNLPSVLLAGKK